MSQVNHPTPYVKKSPPETFERALQEMSNASMLKRVNIYGYSFRTALADPGRPILSFDTEWTGIWTASDWDRWTIFDIYDGKSHHTWFRTSSDTIMYMMDDSKPSEVTRTTMLRKILSLVGNGEAKKLVKPNTKPDPDEIMYADGSFDTSRQRMWTPSTCPMLWPSPAFVR